MTNLLKTLRNALVQIDEARADLAKSPAHELPADYDAVVLAEWLGFLAHDVQSDAGCLPDGKGGFARLGVDALSGFLASFWDTHHLLAQAMPYPQAVRVYFDHASEMLAQAISDETPNA